MMVFSGELFLCEKDSQCAPVIDECGGWTIINEKYLTRIGRVWDQTTLEIKIEKKPTPKCYFGRCSAGPRS